MSKEWRTALSLIKLIEQVNTSHPNRDKSWDGTIADERHLKEGKSDHIPNARGVVTGMDITHDPAHGCDAGELAEALRLSRNPRIKYVISNRRIFSSLVKPWEWREYNGENAHEHHVHISVLDETADDYPWKLKRGA